MSNQKEYEEISAYEVASVEVGDIFLDEYNDEVVCIRGIDGDGDYSFSGVDNVVNLIGKDNFTAQDLLDLDINDIDYEYQNLQNIRSDGWFKLVEVTKTEGDDFLKGLFSE